MIHINKQATPNTIARQSAAIRSGSGWRNTPDTDTDGLRNYFDQLDKSVIRDALYAEQHGLCAYCMQRIHNDESMVIEHWQPIKKDPNTKHWNKNNVLAYSNFLGCCDGGRHTADIKKFLSCDASKGNTQITISPWNKAHTDKIVYLHNGMIETSPHDDNLEHDINKVLNLNGKLDTAGNILHDTSTELLKNRRDVYDAYIVFMRQLGKKYGDNEIKIKNAISKKIAELQNAKVYEPFVGAMIFFLQRRMQRHIKIKA